MTEMCTLCTGHARETKSILVKGRVNDTLSVCAYCALNPEGSDRDGNYRQQAMFFNALELQLKDYIDEKFEQFSRGKEDA